MTNRSSIPRNSSRSEKWFRLTLISMLFYSVAVWSFFQILLPNPAVATLIDLRENKLVHHFSLILNVRDAGLYGHAWITWARHISDEDRSFSSLGYFATSMGSYAEVFNASGELLDDSTLPNWDEVTTRFAVVIWVDEKQFNHSKQVVDEWRRNNTYSLFSRDCVSFIAAVFNSLGVNLPQRAISPTPAQYATAISEYIKWKEIPMP